MTINVGFIGLVLVVLKLTHVIDWSWWWVTLPLWIGPAIVAAFWVVISFVAAVAAVFGGER